MVRPLVLCGPSGSGKSTIMKKLTDEFPTSFGFSVSHTTRQPRPGEEEGVHYHYVSREEMKRAIDDGEFIENAEFSGNVYGTSKDAVRSVCEAGKICILDIEMQGVKQIKKSDLNPLYAFIKPPSLEVLEKRLRDRNTENEESLQKRLTTAREELVYGGTPGNFNVVIVNDDLDIAYGKLRAFILPEIEKQKTEEEA
jgi:guanylate kinase